MSTSTKTKSSTNQTQTSAPPTWTAPGLVNVAQQVTDAAAGLPTTHYTGPMVASMDPADLAAIQAAWGATSANATGLSSWMQGQLPQFQQGQAFTTALPDTSYSLAPREDLNGVISASIAPVQRNLMENILPQMTSSALASGAYSGDRAMGVMPTDAIRDANESMQRIASQLGYEDYQNYENRRLAAYQATTGASQQNYALDTQRQQEEQAMRLQALGMEPDFVSSILHNQASAGDLLRMSAELGQQQAQLGINNQLGMDQYASQAPFMGLDTASTLLARLSGNYGTQTMNGNSTSTTSQSMLPQLLQAGIGAGMMAAGMPGGLSALGGGASSLSNMGSTAGALWAQPQAMSLGSATPLPYMPPAWPSIPQYGG